MIALGKLFGGTRRSLTTAARGTALAVLIVACAPTMSSGQAYMDQWAALQGAAPPASADPADLLLPVDCLLPPRVVHMGRSARVVEPPRPVRVTAAECQARGGVYSYDRADYATSWRIWLPAGEQGDAHAQHLLGELALKGAFGAPDYQQAALWYGRAAEQNYAASQVSLGQLYEQGLGVPQDRARAVALYQSAAGIEPNSGLLQAVTFKIEESEAQAELLAASEETIDRLRAELADLRQATVDNRIQSADAQQELAAERQRLDADRVALASAHAQLDADRAELAALENNQTARRLSEEERARRLAELEVGIRRQQAEMNTRASQMDARERSLDDLEARLSSEQARLSQTQEQSQQLQSEMEARRITLAALEERMTELEEVLNQPPRIEMVDPYFGLTRGEVVDASMAAGGSRTIVGRAIAPRGLAEVRVNGAEVTVDSDFVFRVPVSAVGDVTPVVVTARDIAGDEATVEFTLQSSGDVFAPPTDLDVGDYYALLIGNQSYDNFEDLTTPHNDIQVIGDILEQRYGFNVTRLHDATRSEIITAINEMTQRLNQRDNLLVYYAGHGHQESAIQQGYWLPVNAQQDNPAFWLSNSALTDQFGLMSVYKLLVIADSCYSGTLTRGSVVGVNPGQTNEAELALLEATRFTRTRMAMTSGGLAPVIDDDGSGEHSVFARALIEALTSNQALMRAEMLHNRLVLDVNLRSGRMQQVPEYAPLNHARHLGGDFWFVPSGRT